MCLLVIGTTFLLLLGFVNVVVSYTVSFPQSFLSSSIRRRTTPKTTLASSPWHTRQFCCRRDKIIGKKSTTYKYYNDKCSTFILAQVDGDIHDATIGDTYTTTNRREKECSYKSSLIEEEEEDKNKVTTIHNNNAYSSSSNMLQWKRRNVLSAWTVAGLTSTVSPFITTQEAAAVTLTTTTTTTTNNKNENERSMGMVSPKEVAKRLRIIPTFTITDERGVPFMVFGEDAKVTAYFFTTYKEAERILTLAKESSDTSIREAKNEIRVKKKEIMKQRFGGGKEEEEDFEKLKLEEKEINDMINPWKNARISTVPLEFALTLATRSSIGKGVYFKLAPAQEDVNDALLLDKNSGGELAEGKVPLFYIEDMKIDKEKMKSSSLYFTNFNDDGQSIGGSSGIIEQQQEVSPLYFRKSELISEWERLNSKTPPLRPAPPEIKVTELLSVVREMVKPNGTDEDLQTVFFIPPVESSKKAKECIQKVEGDQFILGERIIVL